MSNGYIQNADRLIATAIVVVITALSQAAFGQGWTATSAPNGLIPMMGPQPAEPAPFVPAGPPMNSQAGGPLARLIANPDQTDGAPPFRSRTRAERFSDDVDQWTGSTCRATSGKSGRQSHDTGNTLLASQLELPPAPLRPMVSNPDENRYAMRGGAVAPGSSNEWPIRVVPFNKLSTWITTMRRCNCCPMISRCRGK